MYLKIQFKQWTLEIVDGDYTLTNRGENGVERFFKVVMGPYGDPKIIVEPALAFAAPEGLTYVNAKGEAVKPAEKIGGIICQETNGVATHRFSLSNAKAPKFEVVSDGIIIEGEHWYLCSLFSKDKNRIINYDAYYVRTKPTQVKLLELADLNFCQL